MNFHDYLNIAVLVANTCTCIFIFLDWKFGKGAPVEDRAVTRHNLCVKAVSYAEQMGGTPNEKLQHAVAFAQKMDQADNGVRDFADFELRLDIESIIGAANSPEISAQAKKVE